MSGEVKKVLRLLNRHSELIIDAYHHNHGEITETQDNEQALSDLIASRLAWRADDSLNVRLSGTLTHLLDHSLRNSYRRHVDANIGGRIHDLEGLIDNYRAANKKMAHHDAQVYWRSIEEQVYDLREMLKNTTRQLWRQITSEFAYVTNLDSKIKENERVLAQAKRLNDGLELTQYTELVELAGTDIPLRRLLLKVLASGISQCQQELCDALHRLKELLFELRKQQHQGHLIKTFYQHFQSNPDFLGKMILTSLPSIINQAIPQPTLAYADLLDPAQELAFTELLSNLRKQQITPESHPHTRAISPDFDNALISIPTSPLKHAVDQFIEQVITNPSPLSARQFYHLAPADCDQDLWLYAILTYLQSLSPDERHLLHIEYREFPDPVFNGNTLVEDFQVSLT